MALQLPSCSKQKEGFPSSTQHVDLLGIADSQYVHPLVWANAAHMFELLFTFQVLILSLGFHGLTMNSYRGKPLLVAPLFEDKNKRKDIYTTV